MYLNKNSPEDDDTSIYHVFERLNTGGSKLYPQEIRNCVDHGPFVELLNDVNDNSLWREIFGKKNSRLKDQELILRFWAMFYNRENYERPMKEFLNKFSSANKHIGAEKASELKVVFERAIEVIYNSLGTKPFRPQRNLNAAVFEAVMVGVAERLRSEAPIDLHEIKTAYDGLMQDGQFQAAYLRSTADEENVAARINLAVSAFGA
ncbi:MAG: hypothetical protein ACMVO3_21505 [Thalassobaculum sp.]